ncbi:MAG: hypothetical protein V4772_13095 [Pseudomonadota bacterium]
MRDTVIASSINFGGAIFWVFRLLKRSITSAKARTEQAISGQMGQPAACMIENNAHLQSDKFDLDYGLPALLYSPFYGCEKQFSDGAVHRGLAHRSCG